MYSFFRNMATKHLLALFKIVPYRYIKFLISGGTAAVVNLGLLFLFWEVFNFGYWEAINVAFIGGVLTNFSLQKLWTFKNKEIGETYRQLALFFGGAFFNILMNNLGMYVLGILLGLWYIFAQMIVLGTLALFNFFFYKHIVFSVRRFINKKAESYENNER